MISIDYASFLNKYRWTHLATVRPNYKITEINAERIGNKLLNNRKVNKIFYAVEKDINDNWYHMHLILDSIHITKNEILKLLGWNNPKVVGFLEAINDKEAVTNYCSKHIGKTALCHNFLIK